MNKYETIKSINKNVGFQIRKLRKYLKLNREKAASVMGTSYSQLTRYERGDSEISFAKISKFALMYSVPLEYFLGKDAPGSYRIKIQLDEE
jgi:transcriptional regulator with XRE-family HTH domain